MFLIVSVIATASSWGTHLFWQLIPLMLMSNDNFFSPKFEIGMRDLVLALWVLFI